MNKRRITTALATRLVNPLVKWAVRRGVAPRSYATLETTGRRSGQARRTPVGHVVEGDSVWIVAEHGQRAGYVRNLKANPRVRIKLRGGWRSGMARVLPGDDPRERLRRMGLRLNALVVRRHGNGAAHRPDRPRPARDVSAQAEQLAASGSRRDYGPSTPLVTVLVHIAYGAIVGEFVALSG